MCVVVYQSTQHDIPDDLNLHLRYCGNSMFYTAGMKASHEEAYMHVWICLEQLA